MDFTHFSGNLANFKSGVIDAFNQQRHNCKIFKFEKKYDPKSQKRRLAYADPFQSIERDVQSGNFDYRQLIEGNRYLTLYRNFDELSMLKRVTASVRKVQIKCLYGFSFLAGYLNFGDMFQYGGNSIMMSSMLICMPVIMIWNSSHMQHVRDYMQDSSRIVQIDLVLNWRDVFDDYVCRHLRITNVHGQHAYVAIEKIQPLV